MTKRLEQAVEEIRKLADEEQDRVAEFLMELASPDEAPSNLTPEQVAGVEMALEQAHRGELASDASIERLLYQSWK